jgi:hypothetical protein
MIPNRGRFLVGSWYLFGIFLVAAWELWRSFLAAVLGADAGMETMSFAL